jgi:tetratricopeptide (TPR) repeat protein
MASRLRFLHPLTRESAYAALLEGNRALLHGAAAEALLALLQPGTADELSVLTQLVSHLGAAGRAAEAHRYCCDALYLATRNSAWTAASELLPQAHRLWTAARQADPALAERSLRLEWATAELHLIRGDMAAAQACLDALLHHAQAQSDREHICRGLIAQASLYFSLGAHDSAEDCARRAEALACMLGDATLERYSATTLGSVLLRMGDSYGALAQIERALAIAREQANPARTAAELSNMASVLTTLGQLERAEAQYRESLELARWLGNAYLTSLAAGNLGDMLHERGRNDEARALLHEALAIAREIRRPLLESYWHNALGFLELDCANLDRARQELVCALALFTTLGDKVQSASALAGLALAEQQDANARAAADYAAQSRALADECGLGPGSFARRMLSRLVQSTS